MGEVVIVSTGDRLTPGYQVTVEPDGALAGVLIPTHSQKPIRRADQMTAINRQRFFADLAKAEPLNRLSVGPANSQGRNRRRRGGRSLPAGTGTALSFPQMFVRYQGQQSPNLRQAGSTPGKLLYQDVKQILQVLRFPIPNVP